MRGVLRPPPSSPRRQTSPVQASWCMGWHSSLTFHSDLQTELHLLTDRESPSQLCQNCWSNTRVRKEGVIFLMLAVKPGLLQLIVFYSELQMYLLAQMRFLRFVMVWGQQRLYLLGIMVCCCGNRNPNWMLCSSQNFQIKQKRKLKEGQKTTSHIKELCYSKDNTRVCYYESFYLLEDAAVSCVLYLYILLCKTPQQMQLL